MDNFRVKITAEIEINLEASDKEDAIDLAQQHLENGDITHSDMAYNFTAKKVEGK